MIADENRLPYPTKKRRIFPRHVQRSIGLRNFTIKEASQYLRVTERTIYRLAASKKIPGFKVGGAWRFSKAEIDQWIRRQSEDGASDDEAAIIGGTK